MSVSILTAESEWSLDLRDPAKASVVSGAPPEGESPDLTLTISDANFAKLVAGKLGPQQVILQCRLVHQKGPISPTGISRHPGPQQTLQQQLQVNECLTPISCHKQLLVVSCAGILAEENED